MGKINIAEILKNCPKGMELDCTMYENVYFGGLAEDTLIEYPILVNMYDEDGEHHMRLTKEGCWSPHLHAKCIIFPKGKTTWEGFQRPFKDGDIVFINDEYSDATFTYVAILKRIENNDSVFVHCFYNYDDDVFSTHEYLCDGYNTRFATEEEKQKLFQAIKDNGYRWNPETKTLDKLIPNKFDINSLVSFESKVLVRNDEHQYWIPAFWGCKRFDGYTTTFGWCKYCIPYEGNEHLLETNNDCNEFYKTWK
jgi:hypothetical protein